MREKVRAMGLRYRKYDIDDFFFDKIDSHVKAYILGVMYADGYLVKEGSGTKRIGIDCIDEQWLIDIAEAMGFTGPIVKLEGKRSGFHSTKPLFRFKISSPRLYDSLIRQGCFEHKTNILRFPEITQVPEDLRNSFILGYMDGDGSLSRHTPRKPTHAPTYSLSFTGTKEMLKGIQSFFNSNVVMRKRHPEREVNNYQIVYGGFLTVYKKAKILYKDSPLYLDRKHKIYLEMSKDGRAK